MNIDLPELMGLQGGAFTARQAAEYGETADELRAMVRSGDLIRVRHGAYTTEAIWGASDDAERHRIEVAAALLVRGWAPPELFRLAAGFESARTMWRLPGLDLRTTAPPDRHKHCAGRSTCIDLVSANRCQRTFRGGVHVHPAALPGEHIGLVTGVPVTSLARTAVDLSREGKWWDAAIVGDAVRRAGVSEAELRRVAQFSACWPGGRQAMRMAAFARPEAESPLESIARAVCEEHGLPAPELQVWLRGHCGRMFRVDLFFRRYRTILEPDGRMKYQDRRRDPADVVWDEKLREDSLRDAGNEVVRATYAQLTKNPEAVVGRLKAAFARSLNEAD